VGENSGERAMSKVLKQKLIKLVQHFVVGYASTETISDSHDCGDVVMCVCDVGM
jgi:hypothetical protein